jgi:glycosyltransferase involved in cell wall biosynthesis
MRRLAILATHPIQYYSPWFAHLARHLDVHVYYAQRQTPEGQAAAGFSTEFEWDLPLLDGYASTFLSNVARRPSIQGYWGLNTPDIGRRIGAGAYDALLMFGWNKLTFLQGWLGAAAARIPVMIRLDNQLGSARSRLKRAVKQPMYSAILPHVADYISPGERSDAYLRHYRVPECRIHRVPHMIDVDRFAVASGQARKTGAAAHLRETYGVAPDETVFLMVGKMIRKKRPLLALDAFSRLRPDARATLWIIGDGPLEGEVDAMIAARALNVRRVGFVNQTELPTYYAAADCLVLPSDADETWGLVTNEAQACGLPAIVSAEAGCAPELIEDGLTGWTLRRPDAEALSQLLCFATKNAREMPRAPIKNKARDCSYNTGTRFLIQAMDRIADRRGGDRTVAGGRKRRPQ